MRPAGLSNQVPIGGIPTNETKGRMGQFRFLSAGESHGRGLTALVEGIPAGVPISEDYIQTDLARRQRGYGRGGRMEIERDRAEITSGVRHGLTMGSPISMLIWNRDWETGGDPDKVAWTDVMSTTPTTVEYNRITPTPAGTCGYTRNLEVPTERRSKHPRTIERARECCQGRGRSPR